MTKAKQYILIEIGEVSQIIGEGFGKPTMKIDIVGMDKITALQLVTTLQADLIAYAAKHVDDMSKRIYELSKLQSNGN